MNDWELEQILRQGESDRVELKESVADKERIREVVCAFANDLPNHRQPGVLFVGVKDNGRCANLPITEQLVQTLIDCGKDGHILPIPSMTVQKRTLAGCEVVVVIVEPADAPPVRYSGRVWVRVGPRRAIATAEEERRLVEKRRARDLPFDAQPSPSATMQDLDLDYFTNVYLPAALAPDILSENQRSLEQQLASLRFATAPPDVQPTYLGLLVSGKDPRRVVPGAYIQFLRIDGAELGDTIKDQKEISGRIGDVLRSVNETLEAHASVELDIISGASAIPHPDYPLSALRQLVYNALMHRTYEGTNTPVRVHWFNDRIEIHNPGGPFGQVTQENFGRPGVTDYRNPGLAEALKNLGYVQRFGYGIALARRELQKNGNPPPEFAVETSRVLVTVRTRV